MIVIGQRRFEIELPPIGIARKANRERADRTVVDRLIEPEGQLARAMLVYPRHLPYTVAAELARIQ